MQQAESRSIELTRERRSQYLEKLIKESPELFQALIKSNLIPSDVLTAPIEEIQEKITSRDVNQIESVLFLDPFTCDVCSKTTATGAPMTKDQLKQAEEQREGSTLPPSVASRVCPVSNQPHRRLLIEVALRFLNLVSEARASIVITKDPIPAIPTGGSLSNVTSPITPVNPPAAPSSAQQGNFPAPSANASGSAAGSPHHHNQPLPNERQKVRRALPRKPHLLVLAFHAASKQPQQDGGQQEDDEMRSLAINIVVNICNIYKVISEDRSNSPNFSRRLQRLLIVFDRTWRSYVLRSMQDLAHAPQPPTTKQSSASTMEEVKDDKPKEDENSTSTSTSTSAQPTAAAAAVTTTTKPTSSGFSFKRALGGIGSSKTDNDSNNNKASSSPQPANNRNNSDGGSTSEPEPSLTMSSVAPSSFGRGGMMMNRGRGGSVSTDEESDTDNSSARLQNAQVMLGPDGKPLTAEQQQQMSLNILMEQKRRGEEAAAREAYSARVRMRQQNAFADGNTKVQKALDSVSEEVESKIFLEELKQHPPRMQRIPYMLRQITESLIGIIPSTRLRQQLERELSDVLDWDVLKHAGTDVVARVMRYVIGKVIELGAPAREEDLRKELDTLVSRLQTEEPSSVIVDSIRFLRSAVRTLGEDIHKAQIALVRPELAKRALSLQTKYLDEWMSPPPQWIDSTKQWIRKHVVSKIFGGENNNNNNNNNTATAGGEAATTTENKKQLASLNWDTLKNALADGVLDLLRSSGRPSNQPRWGEYPTELLYFDKPVIFTTANQIQMLVVRMMIVGTARSILKEYINQGLITHAQVQTFERKLDKQLIEWLTSKTERMSIAQLKDEVEGEVQFFLNSTAALNKQNKAAASSSSAEQQEEEEIMLKQAHVTSLRGVMDQMVDTASAVYGAFEKKILKVISSLVRKELEKRAISRGSQISEDLAHRQENADELASLGAAVSADVSNCVLDLSDMIEHHVAVYSMRYEFILSQGEKY